MNQFNALHSYEPNDPPREWNSQPPAAHFKYRASPNRTSPVVSAIMGRLNHLANVNIGVKVHPSYFTAESNYQYVPYSDTTPIKSINDDKMEPLL